MDDGGLRPAVVVCGDGCCLRHAACRPDQLQFSTARMCERRHAVGGHRM